MGTYYVGKLSQLTSPRQEKRREEKGHSIMLPTNYYYTFAFTFLIATSIPIIGQLWPTPFLDPLGLAPRLLADLESISSVSRDFGRLVHSFPAAVLHPSSHRDIATLLRLSYSSPRPFPVAARGHGHSLWGQAASPPDGVVVEMRFLARTGERRIAVVPDAVPPYVDAGGEQLWADILNETMKYGLAPRSWTDYLHLTVGGTLSVAGISGQAFRHGPQISNVYELDVINGKGETVTCSEDHNPDLFFAVLGGLGQFGIITRARIALDPAPLRVKWMRLIYTEFDSFARDQEHLISINKDGFDYVEGSLFLGQSPINSWRSSFFSESDLRRIETLSSGDLSLYCLEASMYYDASTEAATDKKVDSLLERLSFAPGFAFMNDVPYASFLDRVHEGEMRLRAKGLWEVPHPWLNIFVPASRIHDFDAGVFKGILKHQLPMGPILVYPMNRTKWDERMSAVIPEGGEDMFYSVGLLRSATGDDWEELLKQNEEILRFCDQVGIKIKQYMPHHRTRGDWVGHFGRKWGLFMERKRRYDPKAILSPGQGIFTSPLE